VLRIVAVAAILAASSALSAKTSAPDACRDMAAASDLSDGAMEVAKRLCTDESANEQCIRAAPAAEFAARMALQVTKKCKASLERHGSVGKSPSAYWSYDEPTPPWKPE
jgi:hypothetical protein